MEDRVYLIDLYDLYKELFTDKQRLCFERYYFDDLSLSEISEELDVSRAFIQKNLKLVKEKLLSYESIIKKGSLKNYINELQDDKLKKELERFI